MSKKLNIFLSLILLLLAGACADDDFKWEGTNVGSDEYLLAFTTSAPKVDVVSGTRASDAERDAISELALVVFDAQGSLAKEPVYFATGEFQPASATAAGNIVVKKNLVADGDWYLVANATTAIKDYFSANGFSVSKEDFLSGVAFGEAQLTGDEAHVMLNHADITVSDETQAATQVFNLRRIYTRVTVEINKAGLPFAMTEARLSRYVKAGDLSGAATSSVDDSAVSDTQGWVKATGREWNEGVRFTYAAPNEQLMMASYPFKAAEGAANNQQIMLLVKGYFNQSGDNSNPEYTESGVSYYAIQMPELMANHHVKVMINGADAEGKSTAALAEANPGGLSVEFKDETEEIHNIISDGENVLAVPDTIRIKADDTSWKFDIMARSAGTTAPTVTITKIGTSKSEWLTMPADQSGREVSGNIDNVAAAQGLFTTRIAATGAVKENLGSDRECKYMVKLDGTSLERQVVFLQAANPEVKYSNAIKISLTITHSDGTEDVISDYMGFINPAIVEGGAAEKCYGIQPDENGSRVRNLGIHAPMPNGGSTVYTYNLNLADGAEMYRINEDGSETPYATSSNPQTLVYRDSDIPYGHSNAYGYKVDTDKFIVRQGDVEYALDLYHTGFFHKDGNEWYYYEVMQQDERNLYWLDRNLGAKSAGMGVLNSTSSLISEAWPIVKDNKAMGGRYSLKEENGKYILEGGSCPEGWGIPSYAQMRSLTVSAGFTINRLSTVPNQVTYFAPTFTFSGMQNGRETRIRSYFPQNRMLYEGALGGDAAAGYYLTTTSAGSKGWFQTMQFAGMNVTSQNTDMTKVKMSVRCCAGTYDPQTDAETYKCNVRGFTHVFLYYLNPEDGSKTYLTTWPGEQIAVYSDLSRFHPFEITPTMAYNKNNLYVIFNIVENGVWKDANVDDVKVRNREGVKFVDGGWYGILGEGGESIGADLGNWVDPEDLPEGGGGNSGDNEGDKVYRIAWYKDSPSNGNYRDAVRYSIGGANGSVVATSNDGTRFYVDVKASQYTDSDWVELYRSSDNGNAYKVDIKNMISTNSGNGYDYYIQVY